MSAFDWAVLRRAGIRTLGLKPSEFWGLTPLELAVMLGSGRGILPMTSEKLKALAEAYPDVREE